MWLPRGKMGVGFRCGTPSTCSVDSDIDVGHFVAAMRKGTQQRGLSVRHSVYMSVGSETSIGFRLQFPVFM